MLRCAALEVDGRARMAEMKEDEEEEVDEELLKQGTLLWLSAQRDAIQSSSSLTSRCLTSYAWRDSGARALGMCMRCPPVTFLVRTLRNFSWAAYQSRQTSDTCSGCGSTYADLLHLPADQFTWMPVYILPWKYARPRVYSPLERRQADDYSLYGLVCDDNSPWEEYDACEYAFLWRINSRFAQSSSVFH